MSKRGRISAAAADMVPLASSIEAVQRPDSPYDLTDEESDEWRAVVSRLPADWFARETWPLLTAYCRHVVEARKIAQLIEQCRGAEQFDISAYDKLLKMRERETRSMSSLATRLRMTQQATFDKSKRKPIQVARPWEAR
jgi:hypothetical protein